MTHPSEPLENPLPGSVSYGPLLLALERTAREYEMPFPEMAREKRRTQTLAYQNELLELGVSRFGTDFVFRVGALVAQMDGHPLVAGLHSSKTLPQMLDRWLRFEGERAREELLRARFSAENELEIARVRADGRPKSIVEDAVCLAIVVGFLETFGMTGVRAVFASAPEGRRAIVRWDARVETVRSGEPSWALPDESSRATFAKLVEQTSLTVARTARLLGVSTRTLQRRLEHVGTSFNDLLRLARITRAGRLLLERDASMTEVAFEAGFADGAHLSREFRSFVGIAPAGFRRVLG